MKNTNAINTEQHIKLEQIGSFFAEKQRELRAAQMLKEDIAFRGDLPPSDVENVRRDIVRAVKKLEQEKEIVLPKLTYTDKAEK